MRTTTVQKSFAGWERCFILEKTSWPQSVTHISVDIAMSKSGFYFIVKFPCIFWEVQSWVDIRKMLWGHSKGLTALCSQLWEGMSWERGGRGGQCWVSEPALGEG